LKQDRSVRLQGRHLRNNGCKLFILCEARMRYQEPQPAARTQQARDPETGCRMIRARLRANKDNTDCPLWSSMSQLQSCGPKTYFLQPVSDITPVQEDACSYTASLARQRASKDITACPLW